LYGFTVVFREFWQITETRSTSAKDERQWAKTRTQYLYRHNASGRYYVRAYRQGKEVRKSLVVTPSQLAGNTRQP